MVKIAVLDDWQDVARKSADWSALAARAELAFFADAFGTEDEAAAALADFEILLTMRERTAFPATLIRRLPKLRMISITGASVATIVSASAAAITQAAAADVQGRQISCELGARDASAERRRGRAELVGGEDPTEGEVRPFGPEPATSYLSSSQLLSLLFRLRYLPVLMHFRS